MMSTTTTTTARRTRKIARRCTASPRALVGVKARFESVRSLIASVRGRGRRAREDEAAESDFRMQITDGDARVLVAGANGRLGKSVVEELRRRGRKVTAVSRSAPAVSPSSEEDEGEDMRVISKCVSDLCDEDFAGVGQVVCCVGGSRDTPPEDVEGRAVPALIASAGNALGPPPCAAAVPLATLASWRNIDDAIMGGTSASAMIDAAPKLRRSHVDGECAGLWEGKLVFEGGGFCGIRSPTLDAERVSSIAKAAGGAFGVGGIAFRMRVAKGGERIRLKATIKTAANIDASEYAYQCSFVVTPTAREVRLPLDFFVAVKKASTVAGAPPLRAEDIRSVGFVYSRFEMNGLRNRDCRAGDFCIEMSPLSLFSGPFPQFLLVSSAGVERNALCAGDEERRKTEIPIVRLNPGGVLNWKYFAEMKLRNSNLAYTVMRPTGLVEEEEGETHGAATVPLEMAQGDIITGRITRDEVARVVADVLSSVDAVHKTFELRRAEGGTRAPSTFQSLVDDWSRTTVGLPPLPAHEDPPPPPDEETVADIMKQVTAIQSSR